MIWVWLPLLGPTRWTTVLAFLACIVVAWYRFGPWRGVLAGIAGISTFEIVFSATGTVVHHWPLAPLLWQSGALVAWPVLAWREQVRPSRELLVAFALLWLAWMAEGFQFNVPAHGPQAPNLPAELLNASTKTLMVMAWALPSVDWARTFGAGWRWERIRPQRLRFR
jgi:hypothetical protein